MFNHAAKRSSLLNANEGALLIAAGLAISNGVRASEVVAYIADPTDPLGGAWVARFFPGGRLMEVRRRGPAVDEFPPTGTGFARRDEAVQFLRESHPRTAERLETEAKPGAVWAVCIAFGGVLLKRIRLP